jgi:predicted extracellular nuclease
MLAGLFLWANAGAQQNGQSPAVSDHYRVLFYNLENFFDTEADSTKNDNEFTPDGSRHWTAKKFKEKRTHIFQVITAIAGWEPISLMGFAEIENAFVLEDLMENTPLRNEDYRLVHFESDDRRGIDVGLIYHADRFILLSSQKIPVRDASDPGFTTRDILYVKGLLSDDTLHAFVNHWVSRWRGVMESQYLRILCAETLKSVIDSVCAFNPDANILVMGDFNDNPDDRSMLKLRETSGNCPLVNIPLKPANKDVKGTHKYGSEWSYFDQFLVSDVLFSGKTALGIKDKSGHVFDAPFILEKDEKNLGVKPKRSYTGFKYNGGFSDHLPVFIDIFATTKTR